MRANRGSKRKNALGGPRKSLIRLDSDKEMAIITLTKVRQDIERGPRDRPAKAPRALGRGRSLTPSRADPIVTREMSDVGGEILSERHDSEFCGSWDGLAKDVYIAMARVAANRQNGRKVP
jgi:hypothetical protein